MDSNIKRFWKKITPHKLINYLEISEAERKANIKRGNLKYVFEYLKHHAGRFVKQGDVLAYCDKRRAEDTNGEKPNFGDNSRQIEKLRKDKLPLEWIEIKRKEGLWFKYSPKMKSSFTEEIVLQHSKKSQSFTREILEKRIENAQYRCELTGNPITQVGANLDHFIPKEKGGQSTYENSVLLGEYLNTSKNNRMPVEWFCNTILTNFISLCNRVGLNITEVKEELIEFIQKI